MLRYLPVVLVSILFLTTIVTFSLAFYHKHVTYLVPYISDSGALPPESCIFGQMLNIMAVLMFGVIYVRFLQVREIFLRHDFLFHRLNNASFYCGMMASLGCSVVANFQETALLLIHWTGAVMVFGLGALYQSLQTAICFRTHPVCGSRRMNWIRAFLAAGSSLSFIIFIVAGIIANCQFEGNEITKWRREDGGFEVHVVSTISEWICAGFTLGFLLLFTSDFQGMSVRAPEVIVHDNTVVNLKNTNYPF